MKKKKYLSRKVSISETQEKNDIPHAKGSIKKAEEIPFVQTKFPPWCRGTRKRGRGQSLRKNTMKKGRNPIKQIQKDKSRGGGRVEGKHSRSLEWIVKAR